jgi:tetratricopeptide (TPR) repeat protein
MNQIRLDLSKYMHAPFSFHIGKVNDMSTKSLENGFVCTRLLFDCLHQMKTLPNDKADLIYTIKYDRYYAVQESNVIDQFQQAYTAQESIWWLTRHSCISRLLTRALRMKNLQILFLFGFMIRDIRDVLVKHQYQSAVHVYYARMIPNGDLDRLRQAIGQYIAIDQYILTNLIRKNAIDAIKEYSNLNQVSRVLFEIEANPSINRQQPFANVTMFSYSATEQLVLFSLGSIFNLSSMTFDTNTQLWLVKMSFVNVKKDYDENQLIVCGHILFEHMNRFDRAEQFFSRLVREIPSTNSDHTVCSHTLGFIYFKQCKYDSSVEYFQKALNTSNDSCSSYVGKSYFCLGCIYQKQYKYDQAIDAYQRALQAWNEHDPSLVDVDIGHCWNNLGCIYEIQQFYTKALECHQNALKVHEDFPMEICCTQNNMGNIYFSIGKYSTALGLYYSALENKLKFYSNEHFTVGITLANIGRIYEFTNDCQKALGYYEKAASIFVKHVSMNAADRVQIRDDLERLRSQKAS